MNRYSLATIILLLVSVTSSCARNPSEAHNPREKVTVDSLYEACGVVGETAKGEIPFFDCESYVYGVLDSYIAIRPMLPLEQRACFPVSMPPWKVLEEARAQGVENNGSEVAGPALIETLRKKYPCTRSKPVGH
jgi:hypothetical protein